MKNYGILILLYNVIGLLICESEWVNQIVTFLGYTTERKNIIDLLDIPLYIIGLFIFIWYFKKFSKMQLSYFLSGIFFLIVKFYNIYFPLDYNSFFFWSWFAILVIPIAVFLEENINYKL